MYVIIIEASKGDDYWHYMKNQNDTVRTIIFDMDSEDPYFIIKKDQYYIDENDNVEYLFYPFYITPNDASN